MGGLALRFSRTAFVVVVATCLVACATGRSPDDAGEGPAAVELGPIIRLLDVPPTTDKVRAVPAHDGSVHVLVASSAPRVVTEIVVSPSGGVERRRISSGVSPSRLDAAFDRNGRLHALVDLRHLVFEAGAWHESADTPWQRAGLTPDSARFVAGAPDLVWLFAIAGSEIGARGRWEVYGFGGYPAGIIWPWFTRGTRDVVVADSPSESTPWIVIDPEGPTDTVVTDATADGDGNVHLAYVAATGGMLASTVRHYVKLDPETLAGRKATEWRRPGADTSARPLHAAKGSLLPAGIAVRGELDGRPNYVPYPPHYFGGAVGGGLRISTSMSKPRALVLGEPHDKWSNRDIPVQYVEFGESGWSAPIELGLASHAAGLIGGSIWDAYDIAITHNGLAFAVWPTAQGIVGRWIDSARARPSRLPDGR